MDMFYAITTHVQTVVSMHEVESSLSSTVCDTVFPARTTVGHLPYTEMTLPP